MKTIKDKKCRSSIKKTSIGMVVLGMFATQAVHAGLAENVGVDLKAMSLGNAVVADPPGVASIHYNPAGLANIDGLQTDLQLATFDFRIRSEYNAPKDFNIFTYSDDPVVCEDDELVRDPICKDFRDYGVSKIEGLTLYLPFLNDMVNIPRELPATLPLLSVAYKPPGSKFTYANGIYGQMLGGYHRADDDPGRFMGKELAMQRIVYASPTMAYQVDENLSVGGGVNFTYSALAMNTELRFPNQLIGVFRFLDEEVCAQFKESNNIITDLFLLGLCNTKESIGPFKSLGEVEIKTQDTLSPNFNLGVLYEPSDDFAWGLTYRSKAKTNNKGPFEIQNSPAAQQVIRGLNSSTTGSILVALLGFPNYVPEIETGLVSSEMVYPKSIQTGIKYKLFPNMQFNIDLHWTDWSEWDKLTLTFDREVSVLKLAKLLTNDVTSNSLSIPTGFESVWSFAFGWEYSMTDRLRFRLGYEPRKSSVPLGKRSPLLPINNTQLFGAGIGYSFDPNTEIDLAIAHIRSRDEIPAGSSSLANDDSINNFILNPYAGLNVKTSAVINVLGLTYRTRW